MKSHTIGKKLQKFKSNISIPFRQGNDFSELETIK